MGSDLTETTADLHPVNHHLLSGCRKDVLRKMSGAWKAARRTIVLDANVLLTRTSASSSKGQNPISVMPLKDKRALAEIDHYDGYCPIPAIGRSPFSSDLGGHKAVIGTCSGPCEGSDPALYPSDRQRAPRSVRSVLRGETS